MKTKIIVAVAALFASAPALASQADQDREAITRHVELRWIADNCPSPGLIPEDATARMMDAVEREVGAPLAYQTYYNALGRLAEVRTVGEVCGMIVR